MSNFSASMLLDFLKNKCDTKSLHRPFLDDNSLVHVQACLKSSYVSTHSPLVSELENKCSEFLRVPDSIACSSGTAGLMAIFKHLLGTEPKIVLVPDYTFVGAVSALLMLGHQALVFDNDINKTEEEMNQYLMRLLDSQFRRKDGSFIHKGTGQILGAAMYVDLFGLGTIREAAVELMRDRGIPVVGDCAESFGSFRDGRAIGSECDFCISSFNGNKVITTGGGGLVWSGKHDLSPIRTLISTGKDSTGQHVIPGFNFRLPGFNASLGVDQMSRIRSILEKKARLFEETKRFIDAKTGRVDIWSPGAGVVSNHWLNTLVFENSSDRIAFGADCTAIGMATRSAWPSISSLKYPGILVPDETIETRSFWGRILHIPSGSSAN